MMYWQHLLMVLHQGMKCLFDVVPTGITSRCRRRGFRLLSTSRILTASDLGVTTSENLSLAADMVKQAIKTGQSVL
jgi:hypothetical protein